MIEIVLSGGAFGDDVASVVSTDQVIDRTDADGTVWRYRIDATDRVGVLVDVIAAG